MHGGTPININVAPTTTENSTMTAALRQTQSNTNQQPIKSTTDVKAESSEKAGILGTGNGNRYYEELEKLIASKDQLSKISEYLKSLNSTSSLNKSNIDPSNTTTQTIDDSNLTGSNFLKMLSDFGSLVGDDLSERFIHRWIEDSGILLLKTNCYVDRKGKSIDGVDIYVQQIGYHHGIIYPNKYLYEDMIEILIVEDISKNKINNHLKSLEKTSEPIIHTILAKKKRGAPGRRRLNPEDKEKALEDKEGINIDGDNPSTVMPKPEKVKTALDLMRATAEGLAPMQYVVLDPNMLWVRDVHNYSPIWMAFQRLAYDGDVIGQIEALKVLSKYSGNS